MTDNHTDGTIVEGIVGIHVEEGILEDTSREADLVGGGVIYSHTWLLQDSIKLLPGLLLLMLLLLSLALHYNMAIVRL